MNINNKNNYKKKSIFFLSYKKKNKLFKNNAY